MSETEWLETFSGESYYKGVWLKQLLLFLGVRHEVVESSFGERMRETSLTIHYDRKHLETILKEIGNHIGYDVIKRKGTK